MRAPTLRNSPKHFLESSPPRRSCGTGYKAACYATRTSFLPFSEHTPRDTSCSQPAHAGRGRRRHTTGMQQHQRAGSQSGYVTVMATANARAAVDRDAFARVRFARRGHVVAPCTGHAAVGDVAHEGPQQRAHAVHGGSQAEPHNAAPPVGRWCCAGMTQYHSTGLTPWKVILRPTRECERQRVKCVQSVLCGQRGQVQAVLQCGLLLHN